MPIDSRPEDSLIVENDACYYNGNTSAYGHRRKEISINTLPDEILLTIFDFCEDEGRYPLRYPSKGDIEDWLPLVHVCQRWRSIVFASPRRLNLRIACTSETIAKDTLEVWPALPLLIEEFRSRGCSTNGIDNISALLEHRDRVCQINLIFPSSDLEKISAAMLVPFPDLTVLKLESIDESMPVLPDSFLGGSISRLQLLSLDRIPFPGLPRLLLSAIHLVDLSLWRIPHSGYISPEDMVTVLSTLTNLKEFSLGFQSRSRSDRASPSSTHIVLPVLESFWFTGVSEYFEDLVVRMDAPRVNFLLITFFNQIVFDTTQFLRFISRTPTLNPPKVARVVLKDNAAQVELFPITSEYREFRVEISCEELDRRPLSLVKVCTLCLPPLSALEDLFFRAIDGSLEWQDDIENAQWLEVLRPFSAVKNLYFSEDFARVIVPALHENIGSGTTEVLPALQKIIVEGKTGPSGSILEVIGQFVAARQVGAVSSCPAITVLHSFETRY